MKINEKYQIKGDILNYIIQENKPVKDEESENYGKPNWVTVAYCSNIAMCLKYLVDKEVLETDLVDLKTVINAIENLKKDLDNLHFK